MRMQRIVLGLAVAIGGTAVIAPASSQEYRGTWEQQMACTPDVWRLCGDQIPDVSRIVACLRQNTPQLSEQLPRGVRIQRRTAAAYRGRRSAARSRWHHAAARRNRCSRRAAAAAPVTCQ